MVVMLHGKHLSDEGCEVLMVFLNIALTITNNVYRFPVRAETFVSWCKLAERVHHGMKEYVSCTACHAVHAFHTATEKSALLGRTCSYIEPFPGSSRCSNTLFERNAGGIMKPIRSVFYNSIVSSLKTFFLRDTFVSKIQQWKSRLVIPGVMSDIYDGRVWKSFKMNPDDEVPFVHQSDFNLMLTINCDWFQLYTNSAYSCGAIYITIANLPREVRNLRENVLLCCLLPGPGEPKTYQINHYLRLLVDELLLLIPGVRIQTKHNGVQTVKAALTMVACDLPATRKVIGMTSYNSANACSKCNHLFQSIQGHPYRRNFADAPRNDDWIVRDADTHRRNADIWLRTPTAAARAELEKSNGVRYSELLRLRYFDPIKFVVFDICHNTFMGTAKRMMRNIWREENNLINQQTEALITRSHLKEMSLTCANNFVLPFGYDGQSIGRKMVIGDVGFSHMKSDEFKTWVLAMSPYLLSMRLPKIYYDNWMDFVSANKYLSSPVISLEEVDIMHMHMKNFVNGFVNVYNDPLLMVSNMHFHLHLRETLLDYGPGPSSWIFNFERYNCDIKGIKTNHKGAVEKTFMKKFLKAVHTEDYYNTLGSGSILNASENKIVSRIFSGGNSHGYDEIDAMVKDEYLDSLECFSLSDYLSFNHGHNLCYGFEMLPPSAVKQLKFKPASSMEHSLFLLLLQYYSEVYSQDFTFDNTSDKIVKFLTLDLFGAVFKSVESACLNARGSYIRAFYRMNYDLDVDIDGETVEERSARHYKSVSESGLLRPAQVMFFFRHQVDVLDQNGKMYNQTHTFAFVR